MRTLARLAVLGILVISCRDTITAPVYTPESEPYVCEPSAPDTTFRVYQDSIRLVIGAAESVGLDWSVADGCSYESLSRDDITWTVRDSAIIRDSIPAESFDPSRIILPRRPGATVVVLEAARYLDSVFVSVPDTVVLGPVISVGAGPFVSCAVTDDAVAWCWGGSLGEGLLGTWDDPGLGTCFGTTCSPMPVPRASGASKVYAGSSHACVLDPVGSASCWGQNYSGALGVTSPDWTADPVAVSGGHTFTSLSIGGQHTCGVSSDAAGYCWGDASVGALGGDYRSTSSATPVLVDEDLSWVSIEARERTTCGVTDGGHLYCWGILGTGAGPAGAERCDSYTSKGGTTYSSPCSYVPLRIPFGSTLGADTVLVQASGRCALASQGSVYCYDEERSVLNPMPGVGPFETLTSGVAHTCGVRSGGAAWCWGGNWSGQLGDGTTTDRNLPVAVSGGQVWDQIAAGGDHTCGLTAGQVWCWGASGLGQAGTTIVEDQTTPAKAHGQG